MASVLDAILESTRVPTRLYRIAQHGKKNIKEVAEAITTRGEAEVGPVKTEQGPSDAALNLEKEGAPQKAKSPTLEASTEELDFII
jgi:hypothetical protein